MVVTIFLFPIFYSIKKCVGSIFFLSKHNTNFCHNIILRIRMPTPCSKEDIIEIKSFQLYRVSKYYKGTMVEYFDYNKKWRLEFIVRIYLCDLVLYIFFGPIIRKVPVFCYYTKYSKWISHLRDHFGISILDLFS